VMEIAPSQAMHTAARAAIIDKSRQAIGLPSAPPSNQNRRPSLFWTLPAGSRTGNVCRQTFLTRLGQDRLQVRQAPFVQWGASRSLSADSNA
jgi:hypothetical protein